jgi:hypothetical protein
MPANAEEIRKAADDLIMEHPATWRDDGKLVDAEGMVFAPDNQGVRDLVSLLSARIATLEDALDLTIEEISARGHGTELSGGETLVEFLERTLDGGERGRRRAWPVELPK